MKITIDLATLDNEALRNLAYALTNTEGCRHRGQAHSQLQQLKACINEYESRATHGDTGELREMADAIQDSVNLKTRISQMRWRNEMAGRNPAAEGIAAAKADDAERDRERRRNTADAYAQRDRFERDALKAQLKGLVERGHGNTPKAKELRKLIRINS